MISAPSCPNCGAPVENNISSNCGYCRAPIYITLENKNSFLTDDLVEKYKLFYQSDSKSEEVASKLSLAILYLLDGLPEHAQTIIDQLHQIVPRDARVMLLDCLAILKLNPIRKIKLAIIEVIISKLNICISTGSNDEIASAIYIAEYIDNNYYARNGILRGKDMSRILSNNRSVDGFNDSIIYTILSKK